MGFEASILRRATERLRQQRQQREDRGLRLQQEAYEREPRLRQLDRELRGSMQDLFAITLPGQEKGVVSLEEVRGRNQALQRERRELLEGLGMVPEEVDAVPACPLCGDTGWQGSRMCQCLRELCAQEQIRELSKLLPLGEQSFQSFRMDYYSTLPFPGKGVSPRENMETILSVCQQYAQNFGHSYFKNLFLSGSPGLGKTFLSACIARSVSERGFSVVYDTAMNIFGQFELRKFQREANIQAEARDETRRYLNCDLLILDDLGSEMTTQFTQSALYELINTRLLSARHSVISSNLAPEEIARRYTPQIASRLEGEYQVLRFFGEDIRLLKKRSF